MFRVGLQSYLRIMTVGLKRSTLQQHKKTAMLCEKYMTTAKTRNALPIPQRSKQATPLKTQSNVGKTNKYYTKLWND